MISPAFVVGLSLSATFTSALAAASAGTFGDGGQTLVSAMMMFLGNEDSVYILDKAEENQAQVAGHPAWGALWDIKSHKATVMDIRTNSFCASGMHLPNGSYVAFGGNDAVTTGGAPGSQKNTDGSGTGAWDAHYQDFDGRKSIRILNPCKSTDNLVSGNCAWFDDPEVLSMKRRRWYSAVEPTGEGQVVIIGGMVSGGYVNRWVPNVDPAGEQGLAEPSYEYYPAKDGDPQVLDFVVKTSGLNVYPHTFLMPSGQILLQANLSTALWDHVNNKETPLPAMPNGVVRVYPASGATAMLPLTPANNWTPTILFCGGSDMPEYNYGNYTFPFVDPWTYPASKDCQRLTPEPTDGTPVAYQQDDDMPEGRTMGQFVLLPNGKVLVVNGGEKGTAGYAKGTLQTPNLADQPFGTSLAAEPVLSPAIYDPTAPKGQRWSKDGLGASKIPRLYHSSAILLPDASVIIAGSNPNPDVNTDTVFNTEYRAEIYYPPYFNGQTRPSPQGVPSTLSYGGPSFDLTIPKTSYVGTGNDAADSATVVIIRGGFTTHAMNMGQRFMQLNNTYTVNKDGSIKLHVAQLPPNPNLYQPGPALLFVNINGVPSVGKYVIVGNGQIGPQGKADASVLPASTRLDNVGGTGASGSSAGTNAATKSNLGMIIGGIAAGVAAVAFIFAAVFLVRRRRNRSTASFSNEKFVSAYGPSSSSYPMSRISPAAGGVGVGAGIGGAGQYHYKQKSDVESTSDFAPLNPMKNQDRDMTWDSSTANLHAPYPSYHYHDDSVSVPSRGATPTKEYDHYSGAYPRRL